MAFHRHFFAFKKPVADVFSMIHSYFNHKVSTIADHTVFSIRPIISHAKTNLWISLSIRSKAFNILDDSWNQKTIQFQII